MEGGLKVVFVPCNIKHDIMTPLRKTLGEKFLVVDMVGDLYILDYSAEEVIVDLKNRIKESINEVISSININDCDIYVLANGGILHVALTTTELINKGIDFKYLVYENRIGKYVEISSEN